MQPFLGDPCWTSFDSRLYELVDRLRASGLNRTPEAEFQLMFVELDEEGYHGSFISTFKEKGRVRMVEVFSGKVREWPS